MNDQKITIKYILAGLLSVIFTWIIHEFAHWMTSELFGYDTIMRLNGTSPIDGEYPTKLHMAIISISAPIITVLQGLFVFIILKTRNWNKYLYPFLFTAFYMRLLAGLMNFINVNDEGRVSQYLGIGTFTLSIIVSGLLFYMVYRTSKKYALNSKFQLGTYLIIMIISSVLIIADMFYEIRLI
ncbi:hypothetical protein [Winogradskyella sp. A2]|uniref:hypothetical protein n=1 Tax=Winogradskyella sp. A2 TaxID=3366944 RepID=UPI00398C6176